MTSETTTLEISAAMTSIFDVGTSRQVAKARALTADGNSSQETKRQKLIKKPANKAGSSAEATYPVRAAESQNS